MSSPLHEEDQGTYDFPLLDGPAFRWLIGEDTDDR